MFNMDTSGSWSLGVLIGVPVLVIIVLLVVGVSGLGAVFDDMGSPALYIGGGVFALIVTFGIAFSPLGFYPVSGEYHQWRDVSGTVGKVDSRLISAGDKGGSDTKFVIRFNGSALQFGCDDTRCAQVAEGDTLVLSCKRAWQYTGTDGYDCRFVSTQADA